MLGLADYLGSAGLWAGFVVLVWALYRYRDAGAGHILAMRLVKEDDERDVAVGVDGRLLRRVGVALRLAREVKLRFGGTPTATEANRLLASRYIQDAMEEHGITRKLDKAKVMYRARALVFIPLGEEIEEAQVTNSWYAKGMRVKLAKARGSFFSWAA